MVEATLLVVDDRRDNLFVLSQLLGEYFPGCRVITAAGAAEALRAAEDHAIDAALIDVQMPDVDGVELVRRLKDRPGPSHFPILLLTAHQANSTLRAAGLDAGADDFIAKPVDNVELAARVRVLLRVKRAEDGLRDLNAGLAEQVTRRTRELRASEERLRHAEKLEAIGRLAGGVAHDFNNLLTAIQGNAQLIQLSLPTDADESQMAEEILKASRRAAELTRQLLSFARKGRFRPVPVDVHKTIQDVLGLLERTTDRRIQRQSDLAADRHVILGDAAQLHNALLNLGINACDAMAGEGMLRFVTDHITQPADVDLPGEEYLRIRVVDTGIGMDPETRSHIFEPFFTTKSVGNGTGLGLASVYGCVRVHGGRIDVDSEPGRGTTFTILLPLADASEVPEEPAPAAEPVRGKGTLLVVDDEESVRNYAATALRRLGYQVITAADGVEAVEVHASHREEIDLVILDVIMPGMDGREALCRMRRESGDVRALLSSGYDTDQMPQLGDAEGVVGVLHKPYRIEELSETVARCLAEPSRL